MKTKSEFRDLDRAQCMALLTKAHVGRIAFTFHDRVDIEPVNYVCVGEWIYLRTSAGTKLQTLAHHPWVAFEVDEAKAAFDWQSVVVHGTMHQFAESGTARDHEHRERAIAALRTISPTLFTDDDLAPHRTFICGISVNEITGRSATSHQL